MCSSKKYLVYIDNIIYWFDTDIYSSKYQQQNSTLCSDSTLSYRRIKLAKVVRMKFVWTEHQNEVLTCNSHDLCVNPLFFNVISNKSSKF